MTDKRLWYRHRQTGDLGYAFEHGGEQCIRLDRPGPDEINVRPFVESDWQPEEVRKPLTKHQIALLQFEADRVLCRLLGKGHEARTEWASLKDGERQDFIQFGPCDDGIRDKLFDGIKTAMEGYVGE